MRGGCVPACGACGACGACLEPAVPCLFGWMTCCWDGRVVWRASEAGRWPHRGQVALTIDDVPRAGTTIGDVQALMALLASHNASATFFVIFEQFVRASENVRRVFMDHVRAHGHEVGLHFRGRWGHAMHVDKLTQRAVEAQHLVEQRYGLKLRYARMPGGFSRPEQVTVLEQLGLTVVNGTGYPFDVDLCARLPARALGRCAARLTAEGGRIAILHDTKKLYHEVEAFLHAARNQNGHAVVTLEELLERIGPGRDESIGMREVSLRPERSSYPMLAM